MHLAALVHDDPEANALFVPIRQAADDALLAQPDPIPVIQTEGKLAGDPVKTRTWQSLNGDMPKLQALACAWAVTADQRYANKIREFVTAWAVTNHSAGDPIDDTNLEPLIIACDLIRQNLPTSDRDLIDHYLRGVATTGINTHTGPPGTNINNWNSHRIKIIGLIAFTLQDRPLINQTIKSYHQQIQQNLLPDGSSVDFRDRDALHYHLYDLQPLLTLAIAARNNGYDFYSYRSPAGCSLSAAVAFLLPFAQGTRTHIEFANSTVLFDRQRAANGEGEYKAHPWDPHNAAPILELAQQFDPSLLPLIKKLDHSNAERFPTWQIVLNSVR